MTPKTCDECEVFTAPPCTVCGAVQCPGCGGGLMGGQWCCLDHRCCVDSPDCECGTCPYSATSCEGPGTMVAPGVLVAKPAADCPLHGGGK